MGSPQILIENSPLRIFPKDFPLRMFSLRILLSSFFSRICSEGFSLGESSGKSSGEFLREAHGESTDFPLEFCLMIAL